MTIFDNASADIKTKSADVLLKIVIRSFEWNEDRVTVFLKWTDFRYFYLFVRTANYKLDFFAKLYFPLFHESRQLKFAFFISLTSAIAFLLRQEKAFFHISSKSG